MKEKNIAKFIMTLLILMFAAIGIIQLLLFNFGDNKFVDSIEKSITYANTGDWKNAQDEAQKAQKMWDKGNFIVAIKYSETDFTFLNIYLTRFESAIAQKDANEATKEGRSSIYIFENITSLSPTP